MRPRKVPSAGSHNKGGPGSSEPEGSVRKTQKRMAQAPRIEEDESSSEEDDVPPRRKEPRVAEGRPMKGMLPYVSVPRRPTKPLGAFKGASAPAAKASPERETISTLDTNDVLPSQLDRKAPAFSKRAPIEREAAIREIGEELWQLELPIKIKDLASISPEAREYLRKMVTRRKVPVLSNAEPLAIEVKLLRKVLRMDDEELSRCLQACQLLEQEQIFEDSWSDQAPTGPVSARRYQEPSATNFLSVDNLPPGQFMISDGSSDVPKGELLLSDPVEQYVLTLPEGEERRPIVVAGESYALRTVYPTINNAAIEESLLDGGSQICSIEANVARELGIEYSPDITVFLQSANKTMSRTLGLAKNVPFKFGNTLAYLQLHVIPGAAYKVLLGRPFDVVMATEIKNEKNGNQVLTVTDPNTGIRSSMPTYVRGRPPIHIQKQLWEKERLHFQNSMS